MTRAPMRISITIAGAMLALLLLLSIQPAAAQDVRPLPVGAPAEGELLSSSEDTWSLYACAEDLFDITMQSDDFQPYLELLDPATGDTLAESTAITGGAVIEAFAAPATGEYMLLAASERRSARGSYVLRAALAGREDEAPNGLAYGSVVTGTVTSRAGDSWRLRGCAGDVFTTTLASAEMDAYLELYGEDPAEPLAEDDNSGGDTDAAIFGFELEETGFYTAVAASAVRPYRGVYTLTIALSDVVALVGEETAAEAPSATPTARPSATPTSRPTTPAPSAARTCTVLANGLNVRSGPGTLYAPPIGSLPRAVEIRAVARNQAASWLQIQLPGQTGLGWISANEQWVACGFTLTDLPVVAPPPLPTATPTPTPTPTLLARQSPATTGPTPTQPVAVIPPTPTQPALPIIPIVAPTPLAAVILPGPGAKDGVEGDVITERQYVSGYSDDGAPIFAGRFYLRLVVNATGDEGDGSGIDRVEFSITGPDGDEVYSRTERTPAYCIFGGGEPDCNTFDVGSADRWPDSSSGVESGRHSVSVTAFTDDDPDEQAGLWQFDFEVARGDAATGLGAETVDDATATPALAAEVPPAALVARIVQTGPFTTDDVVYSALAFQVEAFDPTVGNEDGDGIDNVDMRIYGPDGNEVYQRTEGNAAYCAFSGGEPDCVVWSFPDNGNSWPDGDALTLGLHTLRATVNADDGRSTQVEQVINIQ